MLFRSHCELCQSFSLVLTLVWETIRWTKDLYVYCAKDLRGGDFISTSVTTAAAVLIHCVIVNLDVYHLKYNII